MYVMRKILLFTDSLGAGGAQRQLVGLAVMLKKKGYDVKVCTYYDFNFYKYYLDENFVPNELIPRADNTKKRIFAVYNYFKREKPDWVIAYQETPSLVACVAKIIGAKFKLIVSERNTTQKVGINEHVRFFLYHWADVIVPNSYAQEKFIKNYKPNLSDKIKTITNFVDLDKFSNIEHAKNNTPVIVVAATIWESKNTLGLIEAVRILRNMGMKFKIYWYGIVEAYAEYLNNCQSMIDKYGVQGFIELCPKTKEIEKKYAEADFFCLPSFFEGTPNVICEAISTGLPVICSDVCDNSLYVCEGKNGFLFDPQKPESIAMKVAEAISIDNYEYQRYRKESRKIAESRLAGHLFVDKYVEIIEN